MGTDTENKTMFQKFAESIHTPFSPNSGLTVKQITVGLALMAVAVTAMALVATGFGLTAMLILWVATFLARNVALTAVLVISVIGISAAIGVMNNKKEYGNV